MLAQDGPDGIRCFVGIVPGDGRDEVVQHVGLDDTVHEIAADEAEFAVNGGSRATAEVPSVRLVVGKGGIGVLQVGDPNYWSR